VEPSNGRSSVCFADGSALAGCVGRDGRNVGCNRRLWNGCVFGQQAAEGIGDSHSARRAAQGSTQGSIGTRRKLLAFGSAVGLLLGILASRVLAFIVYQASSRDPLVLAGVVLAMALLGLLATWIPAQRALSVDPAILLREE